MEIPERLDPIIKNILARHLKPDNPVIEGETGHLEVVPLDAHITPSKNKVVNIKPWPSFIELSQPPERD